MATYANLSGRSGVVSYDDGVPDEITVTFKAGKGPRNYVYTKASCGASNLARMVALANAGRGLHSFITKTVKGGYARKY